MWPIDKSILILVCATTLFSCLQPFGVKTTPSALYGYRKYNPEKPPSDGLTIVRGTIMSMQNGAVELGPSGSGQTVGCVLADETHGQVRVGQEIRAHGDLRFDSAAEKYNLKGCTLVQEAASEGTSSGPGATGAWCDTDKDCASDNCVRHECK